jgi:hypothetical protein
LTVSAPGLELSDEQRVALETMARSSSLPHRAVVQARGLLLAAEGVANKRDRTSLRHHSERGAPLASALR